MRVFPSTARGLAVFAIAAALVACGNADTAHPDPPQPSVEIVEVTVGTQTLASELPGRIAPVRTAEVRARVPGIVLKREFEEGADVQAGQILFRIDPASFEANLANAQGALAAAEAAVVEAQSVADRYAPLAEAQAVSRQDYQTALTRLKTAQANRRSMAAAIETARLELGYATVRAPISGRIGRALVTEGALVGQNESTPMALIQQLDPIYADFKRPVGDVLRMRAAVRSQDPDAAQHRLPVSVEIPETGETRDGELLFSDISVEPGTGQVSLRAALPNGDGLLLPGMFVRVKTEFASQQAALFVPQRAVIRGPEGASVFVVDADGTAHSRPIKTGAMSGTQWQVLEGLQAGERVVATGTAKVQDGMQVGAPGDGQRSAAQGI